MYRSFIFLFFGLIITLSLAGFVKADAKVDGFGVDYEDDLIGFENALLNDDIDETIPSVVINDSLRP